jgi:hypothetical protein
MMRKSNTLLSRNDESAKMQAQYWAQMSKATCTSEVHAPEKKKQRAVSLACITSDHTDIRQRNKLPWSVLDSVKSKAAQQAAGQPI